MINRGPSDEVYVWDPFVRVFHWLLVAAFTLAFLAGDDALGLHVWAGYAVGILVLLRIVWGFIGPKHVRFGDFLYSPKTVVAYVWGLLSLRSKRYIGHSPGGGVMVIILLLSLAMTVASGMVVYAVKERAGPLAGLFATAAIPPRLQISGAAPASQENEAGENGDARKVEGSGHSSGHAARELHEFFANFTLALVIVHLGAVLLASFVNGENLTKAMITGFKRR